LRLATVGGVASTQKGAWRQVKIASLEGGILIDPETAVFYRLAPQLAKGEMASPVPPAKGQITTVAWQTADIQYKTEPKSSPVPLAPERFSGFVSGASPGEAATRFINDLFEADRKRARWADLMAGAITLASGSTEYRTWRDSKSNQFLALARSQNGIPDDPSNLAASLDLAFALSQKLQALPDLTPPERAAILSIQNSKQLLDSRLAIARSLCSSEFWRECVEKIQGIGLAKWSFSDLIVTEANARRNAARLLLEAARNDKTQDLPARALGESVQAYHLCPCTPDALDAVKMAREDYVKSRRISGALSTAKEKALDEQVSDLKGMVETRPQYVLTKLDALDGSHHSETQMLRAQCLRKLGRISEARNVVLNVSLNIPLTFEQAQQWAKFDAELVAAIEEDLPAREKAAAEALEREDFEAARKESGSALAIDSHDSRALELLARADAFSRDKADGSKALSDWFLTANVACISPEARDSMLRLSREIINSGDSSPQRQGTPNWISGEKYEDGSIYYDPVSMSFQQRISTVYGQEETTSFEWSEQRLTSISTTPVRKNAPAAAAPPKPSFYVEATYEANSVRMQDIGPRKGSNEQAALKYFNDRQENIAIIQKMGKQVAAGGWAGNPFFDPFYWEHLFLFKLEYDERGRVKTAIPDDSDPGRQLDPFSQVLTFYWDDQNRLTRISGDRGYERILDYDNNGRLRGEKIRQGKRTGSISYQYRSPDKRPVYAECESSFYHKGKRKVSFYFGERN
jgi:YD repeat-containing protein